MEVISSIKVIKVGSCSSLSGKATLSYQLGCNATSEIFLRISANSGGGWYSQEWVSVEVMLDAIRKARQPLTSHALQGLFKGKSVNTPAFLFAALKSEALVSDDPDNPRTYISMPTSPFTENMQQLIAAGVDLRVNTDAVSKRMGKSKPKTVDVIPVISSTSKAKSKAPKT